MRIGSWAGGVAAVALASLLVSSAVIGLLVIGDDGMMAEAMEDKWVFLNLDSYGNERIVGPGVYIDSRGAIVASDWTGFCAIGPDGTLLWRSVTNACPSITEGADGRYYYVDWNTSDPHSASWSNITSLDTDGGFRWDYVAPSGTLALWAVYPDGQVIAHNYDWQDMLVDRIIAISDDGSELWSFDSPYEDASFRNPRVCGNGTFAVTVLEADGTHVLGITKDGNQAFIEEGDYFEDFMGPSWGMNETTAYRVRKEFIDNETSVISVYALSLQNGSVEWRTILHYSDNPDHTPPGIYHLAGTLVDAEGRIFCGDIDGKYSYSLDPRGTILWERPYLGVMVDVFPTGGLLVWDDSSIKRVNPDGSLASRHTVDRDGYSFVVLGSDETIYCSTGAEVHAVVESSGLSDGAVILLTLVALDVVAVALYGLARVSMSRRGGRN